MNTGTGVWSILLALGAVLVSAANSKPAEARSSYTNLHAFKATPSLSVPAAPSVVEAPNVVETPSAEQALPKAPTKPKLRRLLKAEISPAMLQLAGELVRKHHAKPVGTEITVDIEGKQVVARIERHFHPEGGPVKPWGFHPGVSLLIAR